MVDEYFHSLSREAIQTSPTSHPDIKECGSVNWEAYCSDQQIHGMIQEQSRKLLHINKFEMAALIKVFQTYLNQ